MAEFELLLAVHCAPTLAGLKPASLVALSKSNWRQAATLLQNYNLSLNHHDLYLQTVCECDRRQLVLVYRKQLLTARLRQPDVVDLLLGCGYGCCCSLDDALACLKSRMREQPEFPHEIGVFLGYPLADVSGFIRNGGKNPVLSGDWKVYGDAESAKRLFADYARCRQDFCQRLHAGQTILQLLATA